jgi:hypothetical protein
VRLLLIGMVALLSACSVSYSFTPPASVGTAKTFSVELFENRAPLSTAQDGQTFTETLRDLLQAQTPLDLQRSNGDVQLSGAITQLDVQPVAIQANETAALNRLTMAVSVRYINATDKSKDSEFSVSRFADYSSTQDLTSVQASLVQEISKQLAQDIFDRTLGNW